jgi:hypothetical protein
VEALEVEALGVEALEAAGVVNSNVGVHVPHHALASSGDAQCVDAPRLEQTFAGMELVALGLLEYAACVRNQQSEDRQSETSLRAPWWLDPNGYVDRTGDTLALLGLCTIA